MSSGEESASRTTKNDIFLSVSYTCLQAKLNTLSPVKLTLQTESQLETPTAIAEASSPL